MLVQGLVPHCYTINEISKESGLTVRTLYAYRHYKAYGFPEAHMSVGRTLLWRRRDAKAWIRRHRAANRR
jgi:predicted DNA-binding transcriptional regulator AlpA